METLAISEIPSFIFYTTFGEMNEGCSGFDWNSIDNADNCNDRTQALIEFDSESGLLTGHVIKDRKMYGEIFDPVHFNKPKVEEYDFDFLNELYDLSKGNPNPRY